ncbi:anti-anti-sigma factor [Rhodospirillum rubrum]|uniref:STAS domain-containing protein n=1 Tax=Rhodospirillum rubrum TaxID=1085 RepID=UPI0019075E94|nr:STAS domain-containing protein [Rhodospirillum rubrum]MBK1662930.1 anti-anti-sigma factor [Rhodospirillum rubrum]MBK1675217.1 anti-anti-sigma factor [Rhodospirillum rubrum]
MGQDEIGDLGIVHLDGVQTLRTADETYSKLREGGGRYAVLEIDCLGVTEVDLSFIQMLIAARTRARSMGRTLRLAHPASGALLEALERGGFLTGIPDQATDQAFWLQPEKA